MPTRNIVPRGDGEGSVGTSVKKWDALWVNKIKNVDVDDLIAPTEDYRQPNTAYTVGTIKYHASLPTGYYLECTTAGTTSSGDLSIGGGISVYDTITDGTVTWIVCNVHVGAFNTKQTFTSSGTFTAPVSGTYRITLQGGGGGGAGATTGTVGGFVGVGSGGGGGEGGHLVFYKKLTAGTTYSYIIGAGGAGGTGMASGTTAAYGSQGGTSTITIGSNTYTCIGGYGGTYSGNGYIGGVGGEAQINGVAVGRGGAGGTGISINATTSTTAFVAGGTGGGAGGGFQGLSGSDNIGTGDVGVNGGGGQGGHYIRQSSPVYSNGSAGGNGYITFEYCNV